MINTTLIFRGVIVFLVGWIVFLTIQTLDLSNRTVELAKVNYQQSLQIKTLSNAVETDQDAIIKILNTLKK